MSSEMSREAAGRPNILWICTDQQRWDTLGCYGNEFVQTPNIDRLAENGVVFSHCYTQSPVCMPSRGSFLTEVSAGSVRRGQRRRRLMRGQPQLVTPPLPRP